MEIKKLNKITIILISMFVTLMAFSMPVKALALSNPGFESGTTPWLFYTNGAGSFTVGPYGYVGINAAKLTLNSGGGNIQLFQTGVALEANTRYRLSFAAYSTAGHDVTVRLFKHGSPYTAYAPDFTANLGMSWQTFSTEFTSSGFSGTVNDGRLQFWLAPYAAAGDIYYIDDVQLEKVSSTPISPAITMHPLSQTVASGQAAIFNVVATGTAPLTYQWQNNGTDIFGATGSTYTTPATTLSDNGAAFQVIVSNSAGSVTSNPATLTVLPPIPPIITTHPSNQAVSQGQTATFTVVATGSAPLAYQWQKNGTNIFGATGPSYTTPATILSDNGSTYRVIVSNAADIIMSNAATLTVNPSTSIGLIMNPGFESGTTPWLFYTSGAGSFTVGHYGYVGINAAKLTLNSGGGNIQLFQTGVALEANTRYRLSFAAYSTAGHDVTVRLFKHGSPYTAYAPDFTANLGMSWQTFSTEFTSSGFSGTVNDGRLQFWLAPYAAAGDIYYIDDVQLEKVSSTPISPAITMHPLSQTVASGQAAIFNVVATGTAPLTYQWQNNGTDIFGATGSTYTTPATTLSDNGAAFQVIVSNSAGSVTSNPATLTVLPPIPPIITTHPSNQAVSQGQTATFTVVATGSAPLAYQWQKNGTNIFGATGPSYTTPATILSDNDSTYRVIVSNAADIIMSNAATLTVNPTTSINLIMNPGFESGTDDWWFYINGKGFFTVEDIGYGYQVEKIAHIGVTIKGTNIQLFQMGLSLKPYTKYRLTFDAYSTTAGHDLAVNLLKHGSPYTNYGLSQFFDLGTDWQTFTVEFTTNGFYSNVNDGRLMFWLAPYASAGDNYFIDNVKLEKI